MIKSLKKFLKHESVVDEDPIKTDNDDFLPKNSFDAKRYVKQIFSKNIKLAAVMVILIIILAANLSFILKKVVNTQKLKTFIEAEITEITGKKATITGDIDLEVAPEALVKINSLILEDDLKLGTDNFAEIKDIKIKPKLFELFIGRLNFDNIYIGEFIFNVKKPLNAANNFEPCLKNIAKFDNAKYSNKIKLLQLDKVVFNIIKGTEEALTQRQFLISNLKFNLDKGNFFSGTIFDDINFNGSYTDAKENNLKINFTDDTKNITLTSTLTTAESIKLSGYIDGTIKGFNQQLIQLFFPSKDFAKSLKQANSFDIKSDVYFNDNKLVLPNLKISNDYFSSNIKFGLTIADELLYVADIEVPTLDTNKFFPEGFDFIYKQISKATKTNDDSSKFLIDFQNDVKISAQINFLNINLDGIKINANTRFDITGNNIDLTFLNVNLPGNSIFHLSSNLKLDKALKAYIGSSNLSILTENSAELFKVIDPNNEFIPNNTAKLIALKSDIYTYEDKVHFRKIDLALDDNRSIGQLVIDYSSGKTTATSAFNFGTVDLDQFSTDKTNETTNLLRKLDFLRYVDNIFDVFNISVQTNKLTYNQVTYTDFSSFITVQDGKVLFNQLQMTSDDNGEITGKFDIELNVFQPKLNLDMRISNYTLGDIEEKDTILDGQWPDTSINLEKYSLVTGSTKLKFDNISFYGLPLRNFVVDAFLNGDKIKINKSRFDYYTSKFDFEGEITTQYPSLSLSFITTNLDINKLFAKAINNKSVSGKVNLSGNFAMNGANLTQWLKSLKGAINFTSTGVRYDGIDIENLSQKISQSSKIRDVRMWSDKYLSSGNTIFTYLDGSVFIDKGILEMKDVKLTNEFVRSGTFYAKYDLVNWSVDSILDMTVKTFDKFSNVDFPVQITYKGNVNNPVMNRDIQGIEKYWENKFYSR